MKTRDNRKTEISSRVHHQGYLNILANIIESNFGRTEEKGLPFQQRVLHATTSEQYGKKWW